MFPWYLNLSNGATAALWSIKVIFTHIPMVYPACSAADSIVVLFAGNEWSSQEHALRVVLHRIPQLGTGHVAITL